MRKKIRWTINIITWPDAIFPFFLNLTQSRVHETKKPRSKLEIVNAIENPTMTDGQIVASGGAIRCRRSLTWWLNLRTSVSKRRKKGKVPGTSKHGSLACSQSAESDWTHTRNDPSQRSVAHSWKSRSRFVVCTAGIIIRRTLASWSLRFFHDADHAESKNGKERSTSVFINFFLIIFYIYNISHVIHLLFEIHFFIFNLFVDIDDRLKIVWNHERLMIRRSNTDYLCFYWNLLWLFWKIKLLNFFKGYWKKKKIRRYFCLRNRDWNKSYFISRGTSWNVKDIR